MAASIAFVPMGMLILLNISAIYLLVRPEVVLCIYNITVPIAALAGLALSISLYRSFGKTEVLRKIWAYFSLGLLLWTVGEVLWSYEALTVGQDPSPRSFAGIVWLAGYAPVSASLIVRYRSLRISLSNGWRALSFWSIITLAAGAAFFLIISILRGGWDKFSIETFVSVLFPLGDLVLGALALLITLLLVGGTLSRAWGLVALGLFVLAVSDLLYAFAAWQGVYRADLAAGPNFITSSVDILYAAAYFILDLGLFLQARLQRIL